MGFLEITLRVFPITTHDCLQTAHNAYLPGIYCTCTNSTAVAVRKPTFRHRHCAWQITLPHIGLLHIPLHRDRASQDDEDHTYGRTSTEMSVLCHVTACRKYGKYSIVNYKLSSLRFLRAHSRPHHTLCETEINTPIVEWVFG